MWQNIKSKFSSAQESPPLLMSEIKPSYDVIKQDTDSATDESTLKEKSESPPVTARVIIELIVCFVGFIGDGLCLNSVGPTLMDLRQIAGITVPQSAFIFIFQSVGFLTGTVLANPILERMNDELALGMCLSLQALCTALIPAFGSPFFMCLMFTGQGFSLGVTGIGVCAICIKLGGKARSGMFIQSVFLGVSIGSVLGPFVARPFLSTWAKHKHYHQVSSPGNFGSFFAHQLRHHYTATNSTSKQSFPTDVYNSTTISNGTTTAEEYIETDVLFYYIIIGLFLSVPAFAFFLIFFKRDSTADHARKDDSPPKSLALADCTAPLIVVISLMFMLSVLYFGIQDAYSNLLTTFAVLGPLHMPKTLGVYLASAFWASMCFGRLNGIWIAKLLSPFKMLAVDIVIAGISSIALMSFGGTSPAVLWSFSILLGVSLASISGATVSWAVSHLPGNNYILSIIMVGRCAGLLILPATVTALFKATGPMTLMYTLFFASVCIFTSLIVSQIIVRRYGIRDKLYSKSDMQNMLADE